MRGYLDWPALPGEARCCDLFDKGKSLTDGLSGRLAIDTAPWSAKDDHRIEISERKPSAKHVL